MVIRVLLILWLLTTASAQLWSQTKVEIGGFGGYQFGGKFEAETPPPDGETGDVRIKGGAAFGGTLSFFLPSSNGMALELSYNQQNTEVTFEGKTSQDERKLFDGSVQYLMIGAHKAIDLGGLLTPFGVFSMGGVRFNPQNEEVNDAWEMAVGLGGGIKVYPSRRVGFRAQLNLLMPLLFGGTELGCEVDPNPNSCRALTGSTTVVFQGNVTGGITIRLGN